MMTFAAGFLSSGPVHTALIISGAAALVSAVIGVFTVMRGQAFAGEAFADVSSAGGSAAFLAGVNPLLGFLCMAVLAAMGMELANTRKAFESARERDLVTGIILGAGLGLTALFLYFSTAMRNTSGAAVSVMFGSMFTIPATTIPLALAAGAMALAVAAILYRPLLLSTLSADLAEIRGVKMRVTGFLHLAVLALAVALSAMTVGAVLSTALLIGPAAAALRLTNRPGLAILLAVMIGVAACWGGIWLAYDSFYWTPGHGWPVSFFIVTLIFMAYLAARLPWISR